MFGDDNLKATVELSADIEEKCEQATNRHDVSACPGRILRSPSKRAIFRSRREVDLGRLVQYEEVRDRTRFGDEEPMEGKKGNQVTA